MNKNKCDVINVIHTFEKWWICNKMLQLKKELVGFSKSNVADL